MTTHPGRLIGMVHVGALPGTPRSDASVPDLAAQAASEARELVAAGFDTVLIENMHDVPYLRRDVGPEIVSGMAVVAAAVRSAVDVPVGIQILAGANRAAMAVAHAAGLQFIRAEGFVFASVADEGLMEEADAGPLLRYRKAIGADDVAIYADVKKKHSSHTITADVDLAETVRAASFFGADGVVITGTVTGAPTDFHDIRMAREASDLHVLVGSGVEPDTAGDLLAIASGVIVGSWLKRDGLWSNPVDAERARAFIAAAKSS